MLGAIAATCAFAGLNVAAPKYLGDATDVVVDGVLQGALDAGRFGRLLAAVTLMYVLASLFNWIQGALTARSVQGLMYRLRASLEDKLHRLPSTYFQERSRGDVLSRATNDIDNIAQALNQLLTQLIMSFLMLCGSLAMMLWISPLLAVIAIASVPLSTLLTVVVARRSQAHFARQWTETGELNAHVEEFVTGHEVIKAFGHQAKAAEIFARSNDRLARAATKAQYSAGVVQPLMVLMSNLNYIAVAVVGALQVIAGAMTIGGIQAFVQFSRLFSQPVGQIGGMLNLIQSCAASAARVFALLDTEVDPAEPVPAPGAVPPGGRIVFEDVTFGYPESAPAVRNLSFAVEPGQTVAIVGHTGAGKTTVVNLLMRFYEPGSGRITMGGTDIAAIPRDLLRQQLGVVLQESWLFAGTIRENIAYGRPGATEPCIVAAAEASHVDRFVRALPAGYDTVLENGGEPLSQGQRQLLTIARAQLAGRAVLVLDEATSSVDSRTELLIRQAMQQLRQGRTSFVIAHRLSTVRNADLILVMDHGRIVEQGTHHSLLAANGYYARLHNAQFSARTGQADALEAGL
ncbi:ABC transporter ATP-binding protein [Pseudarthrobacter phenanthrenivorans]|uniref:Fatty acid ABC transporter ATP-binding/permease protein n=1 Tax=Pseudarthrobacter phenanthrenivorans (strain DSM 18606 / JCM 16027 / LMG 23796 / Sphe3) TaxID=930171 RepID=F0MBL9_PSEPM|nr:ABC transporter ATP-binding protein [Pseudarthrobacter phenanthrenivorans]ADX72952.1 ABC-type multidrug transport system, ATPase and permease component [Pseudarthrobacter phenanthrenivorans Sphe3]TPV53637.1 ABC transporter ATP-binding protein [Pseudarthrobacter phenanthrenivorans]